MMFSNDRCLVCLTLIVYLQQYPHNSFNQQVFIGHLPYARQCAGVGATILRVGNKDKTNLAGRDLTAHQERKMFIKLSHATVCHSLCPNPQQVVFACTLRAPMHTVCSVWKLPHLVFPMVGSSTFSSCGQMSSLQGNKPQNHASLPFAPVLPSCQAQLYFSP